MALRVFALALAGFLLSGLGVLADGRVTCYTTWDDHFFYFAAQIDDSNVVGTNTKPNSQPWEDDDVEVFLEVDNNRARERTPQTFQMCVSPAGGSAWVVGEGGRPTPKPIFSYKYATSVQGTLNDPDDLDIGYSIELAMPWLEMGVRPTAGMAMSFNVLVHCRGGENKMLSLSPNVKTEEDAHKPEKWVNIVFTGPAFAAVTTNLERIICARYIARMPLIDGQIKPKEWNRNTSFDITIPETPEQKAARLPVRSLQKSALTYYFYWYQGDPRRPAALSHVRGADGASHLTTHPISGEGPWFSYDRVSWHKKELTEIRGCGIDVILPIYWGGKSNRASFASKGLDCMVEALKELRSEKKPYPLVGMFFDTSCMRAIYGNEKPDLRTEEPKRAFYGVIRDFFLRIPKEFRATAHLLDERAGQPTYIVDLYHSLFATDFDESLITYCNEQFEKDFGAKLCWIGGGSWKGKGFDLDGYCSYGSGLIGPKYDEDGRIRIGAVGAGYDDTAVAGRSTPIRSRMGGQTYKDDWAVVTAKKPHWIMVDGWNEFHEGSDICGSRQYGFEYVAATAMQLARLRTQKEYDAKVLWHNAPPAIEPGELMHVTFLLKNDGLKPWLANEGYALIYTWFKDGRPYQEGLGTPSISGGLLPGHAADVTIGISAMVKSADLVPDQKIVPLQEGEYELFVEVMRLHDSKRFSALGDDPFIIPIKVGKIAERGATIISVDAPTLVPGGKDYPATIHVRNDGRTTWKASEVKMTARMFKVQSYTHDSEEIFEPVEISFTPVPLPRDVPRGTSVEIAALLNAKDGTGNALPSWSQDQPWSYLWRWEIADADGPIGSYDQILGVFDHDMGAHFIDCDLPSQMTAGKNYEVKIVLRNNGAEVWHPKTHEIAAHWYYLDGVEMLWDSRRTPLREEMQPGDIRMATAQVTAPPYDGQYRLVLDLAEGNRWASTEPISRGGDSIQRLTSVTDGKLVFVDLNEVFDKDVISPDTNPKDGDFDGRGFSLPAEMLPPELSDGKVELEVYPSGYWNAPSSGPDSQRRISFRYPDKSDGAKNAVSCASQSVQVPPGKYKAIHILGAADSDDAKGVVVLSYQGITGTSRIALSNWSGEPQNGEKVGFVTLHRHSPEGDERGVRCYLHHAEVEVDPSRTLSAIALPDSPPMKILAITLEKAD